MKQEAGFSASQESLHSKICLGSLRLVKKKTGNKTNSKKTKQPSPSAPLPRPSKQTTRTILPRPVHAAYYTVQERKPEQTKPPTSEHLAETKSHRSPHRGRQRSFIPSWGYEVHAKEGPMSPGHCSTGLYSPSVSFRNHATQSPPEEELKGQDRGRTSDDGGVNFVSGLHGRTVSLLRLRLLHSTHRRADMVSSSLPQTHWRNI